MKLGRILIPLYQDPLDYQLLEAAQQLMAQGQSCLQVAYCRTEPVDELMLGADIAASAGLVVDALEQESQRVASCIQLRLRDWIGQHGYSLVREQIPAAAGQVSFVERVGLPAAELTRLGRVSDLILCLKPNEENSSSTPIFDSIATTGRPVLAVPLNGASDLLQHVLIAWDGSLVASRMISQILPVLAVAKRVSIFCYPESDCDADSAHSLAQYLAVHNITALNVHVRRSKPIGEALADAASAEDAGLVAMGAYSHSRPRQFFLGGLTRHMLEKTNLALLMAH